jgi:hypothetical protein
MGREQSLEIHRFILRSFPLIRNAAQIYAARICATRICAALTLAALFCGGLGAEEEGRETLVWRRALGGRLIAQPLIRDGTVTVLVEGGRVAAFSESGRPLWNYTAGHNLTPFAGRAPDAVTYLCRTDGRFIALNRAGQARWKIALDAPFTFAPLSGYDGRVFVFSGSVVSCYTESGNRLWRRPLKKAIAVQPVSDGYGGVEAVLESGLLLTITPFGNVQERTVSDTPLVSGTRGVSEDTTAQSATRPSGGNTYRGGKDWILYAYRQEYPALVEAETHAALASPERRGKYGLGDMALLSRHLGGMVFADTEVAEELAAVAAALESGETGAREPYWTAFLLGVAGGASALPGTTAFRSGSDPEQRVEALRLLSRLGSRETIHFLVELMNREKDTRVKAACAETLGAIGADPENTALAAFAAFAASAGPYSDDRFYTDIVKAAAAICRFSGPLQSVHGVPVLRAIAGNPFLKNAAAAARAELSRL